MEIIIKLRLQSFNLFSMLILFISKIISQSLFLLSQFTNLELSLFIQSHKFHINIAYLVLFLLTVLFQFSNFKLVLFVIIQMISFQGLNLHMMLIFQLIYLHILHMLNIGNLLFQLLYLIQQPSILQIT